MRRENRGAFLLRRLRLGRAYECPPHRLSRGKRLPRKLSAMAVVAPAVWLVVAAERVEAARMGSCSRGKEDRDQEREQEREPEAVRHGRLRWQQRTTTILLRPARLWPEILPFLPCCVAWLKPANVLTAFRLRGSLLETRDQEDRAMSDREKKMVKILGILVAIAIVYFVVF